MAPKAAQRIRASRRPTTCSRAIGYGKLSAKNVLGEARAGRTSCRRSARTGSRHRGRRSACSGTGEDKIKVRGSDDLLVFRARCCNPIRGEKIVGYITRGKGVSVHSATCPNVVNLLYDPERRIDVEWDKGGGEPAAATPCS